MIKQTIDQILQDQTITNDFDFKGSVIDSEGVEREFTIFDTEWFITEVLYNYYSRLVMIRDPENAFTEFKALFDNFVKARAPLYAKIMYAYSMSFNPIENYSSIETHTGHDDFENHKATTRLHTNDSVARTYQNDAVARTYQNDALSRSYTADTVTRTHNADAVEVTHTNDKDTTTYNSVKDDTNTYKYGINSATKVPEASSDVTKSGNEVVERSGSTKETHTGGYSDTHTGGYSDTHTGGYSDTHTGGYSDTHTGGYSDTNSGTDSQIYNSVVTKSGNIGVMTPGQMIASDYDSFILHQDLQQRAIKEFIQKYTFYNEGVSIW